MIRLRYQSTPEQRGWWIYDFAQTEPLTLRRKTSGVLNQRTPLDRFRDRWPFVGLCKYHLPSHDKHRGHEY
jgi:hypothetical protein